ncbi:hypothetical protein [Hyphomonas sp.]|tara:strand:- start:611 stop:757 length:147 start_codon:yes stop_codon:yes gene_type:complete
MKRAAFTLFLLAEVTGAASAPPAFRLEDAGNAPDWLARLGYTQLSFSF